MKALRQAMAALLAAREQLSFPGIPGSDPDAEQDAAVKALERLLQRKGAQLHKQMMAVSKDGGKPPPIRASMLTSGGWNTKPTALQQALQDAKLPEHEVVKIASRFTSVEPAPPGKSSFDFRDGDKRENGKRVLAAYQPEVPTQSLKIDERGEDPTTGKPVPSVLKAILAAMRVKTLSEALDRIADGDGDADQSFGLPENIGFFPAGEADDDHPDRVGSEPDKYINKAILYATPPLFLHLLDEDAMLRALKPLVAEAQDRGTKLKEQIEALFKKLRIKPEFSGEDVRFSTTSVPKVEALGVPVQSWRNGGRAKLTDLATYFEKNPQGSTMATKPKSSRKTNASIDAALTKVTKLLGGSAVSASVLDKVLEKLGLKNVGLNADWSVSAFQLTPGKANMTPGIKYLLDNEDGTWSVVRRFYAEDYEGASEEEKRKIDNDGNDLIIVDEDFSSFEDALMWLDDNRMIKV
jgi:hypothetical protein